MGGSLGDSDRYPAVRVDLHLGASKDWPEKQNKDWWLANGQAQVNGWRSFLANSPWQIMILPSGLPRSRSLSRPRSVACPSSGTWTVSSKRCRPDVRAVVDLKSGAREPKVAETARGYALGLKRTIGLDVTWASTS